MDQFSLTSLCRFCLTNRTVGYGTRSFVIDEKIQENFEEFSNLKLIITPSRPKLICHDCKSKFDYSHSFRNMILESQSRLNHLLPHENLETCLVTVKQENPIDETHPLVIIKVERDDEQIDVNLASSEFEEETSVNHKTTKKRNRERKISGEETPRKSSRSRKRKSYNEKSPEPNVESENMPKKRGRPRKPKPSKESRKSPKRESALEAPKVETIEEASKDSIASFDRFDDAIKHDSSDDDFNPLQEDEQTPKTEEVSTEPEIFAKCTLCPKRKKVQFRDEDDQKIHNEMVHEDVNIPFMGPYKCKSCPKVIGSEIKMRRHVRQFHLFKNEKLCTTCGKTFYDRRAFYCHIDKNHGIRNVTCPVEGCGKMFNGKMNLGKHLKTHLPDGQRKVYICDRCGSRYINKDNIKPHMLKCDGRTFKDHTLIKPRRKLNRLKCYINLGIPI